MHPCERLQTSNLNRASSKLDLNRQAICKSNLDYILWFPQQPVTFKRLMLSKITQHLFQHSVHHSLLSSLNTWNTHVRSSWFSPHDTHNPCGIFLNSYIFTKLLFWTFTNQRIPRSSNDKCFRNLQFFFITSTFKYRTKKNNRFISWNALIPDENAWKHSILFLKWVFETLV